MEARIRHIPWTYSTGDGFGHHYITQDLSLPTADQFDIAVFPRGDKSRIAPDPLRDMPHIHIRTWDGHAWQLASITPIPRTQDDQAYRDDVADAAQLSRIESSACDH